MDPPPLYTAAATGATTQVQNLIREGANVEVSAGSISEKRLHEAARSGHADIAAMLLEAGANAMARNNVGWMPLHHAASGGHEQIVTLLVDAGADVAATILPAKSSPPRLHFVDAGAYGGQNRGGETPLALSVHNGHAGVLRLLLDAGAEPSARGGSEQATPLHLASRYDRVTIARMLLAAAADPNARNRHMETPLHCAARRGAAEIVRLLLDAGADAMGSAYNGPTDAMARMSCSMTPLHRAAAGGHEGVLNMLLDAGADGEAKNDWGDTPEDHADSHPRVQPPWKFFPLGFALCDFAPFCASQRSVTVQRF